MNLPELGFWPSVIIISIFSTSIGIILAFGSKFIDIKGEVNKRKEYKQQDKIHRASRKEMREQLILQRPKSSKIVLRVYYGLLVLFIAVLVFLPIEWNWWAFIIPLFGPAALLGFLSAFYEKRKNTEPDGEYN